MADLQVTLGLLLENQAELARELERAGGQAGEEFRRRLQPEVQRAFDDLIRKADEAARRVQLVFNRTTLRFESPSGEVIPQRTLDRIASVNKGFAEARQAVETFRAAAQQASRESAQSFDLLEEAVRGVAFSLTNTLTNAAGNAIGSLRGLVGGFLELDGELRLAAAAAGEQGGYERLGQIVDKVGIEAAGTSKQVAELATSLVRAGFSVSEVEGALPGVVKGAEATGTSFERMGDIVGNTLRGFGLEVDQTARVVDVLVNTANSSNASIEGLGYTFEYTAPIAKALGVSLEDVATAAGLMANAGIQGSVAGTGLRTFLQKLQQAAGGATPEVMGLMRGQERLASVMRKLGAEVVGTNGKLLPMEQVLLRLKAGFDKLNEGDKVSLSNVLFGDEASSKVLAMINQSGTAITKMSADIRNSTGATNAARGAMAGMGLELQQLTGTMDSLRNNLGSVIAAGLRPLVGLANAAVGAISAMPTPLKDTASSLILLGIAATGASVSIAALQAVAAQVGGFVALRTAAAGAATAVFGMGATIGVVLALAAVVGLAAGQFKEMDKTSKTLLQTTVAFGVAVVTFRAVSVAVGLAVAAMAMFNKQLTIANINMALARGTAARGGWVGTIVSIAAALGVAAVGYKVLGDNVQTAGAETEGLSEKVRGLNDEITKLQKDIAEGKRLGVNTDDAERQLEILRLKRDEIQQPLELKLDIEKAKGQVKELQESFNKAPQGDSTRAPIFVQLEAAKRYQQFLEQLDKKQAVTGSPIVQELGRNLREIEQRVDALSKKRMALPLSAKAERSQIEKEIDLLQRQFNLRKARVVIELNAENTRAQFNSIMGDIAAAKNRGEDTTKMESNLQPMRNRMRILQLEREKNEKDLAQTLDQTVKKEEQRVKTAQEQLAAAKAKLEVEQMAASVADRAAGLDSARLKTVREVADAYSNLASAQAALVQSGFDVERSRNSQSLGLAERELQFLRERGASVGAIRAAEERIAAIKRDGEAIEFRAMQANIQASAQRFAIERQLLELKQRGQILEQEGAVRAAQSAVLQARMQLNDLQSKGLEKGLTPDQKAANAEQVKLQQQAIGLAGQQLGIERERYAQLGLIFNLERQAQEAQQQTTANQQRAQAAGKGWETVLAPSLDALDRMAGAVDRVSAGADRFYGTLQAGGGPVQDLIGAFSELPKPLGMVQQTTGLVVDAIQNAITQQQAFTGEVQGTADAYLLLSQRIADTMKRLPAMPTPRFAGGDAIPGRVYQVNELGPESFLSASGALSMIKAPAYGSWSPPTAGMVLPAGLTERLDAMGAFDAGPAGRRLTAAVAPVVRSSGNQSAALGRLQRSIDRLEGTMRSYQPTVTVNLPSNAGLLHTLQSFR